MAKFNDAEIRRAWWWWSTTVPNMVRYSCTISNCVLWHYHAEHPVSLVAYSQSFPVEGRQPCFCDIKTLGTWCPFNQKKRSNTTFFSRNSNWNFVIPGDNVDCHTEESYGKHQVSSHLQMSLNHHLLIFIWLSHHYCIKRLCVRCWQELCIFRFLVTLVWQIPTEIYYFLCIHLNSLNTWSPASSHSTVLQLIPQRQGPYSAYYANAHLGLWQCQSHHHNTCSIFILIFHTTGKMLRFPVLKTSRSCTLVWDLPSCQHPSGLYTIMLHIGLCVHTLVRACVYTPTYMS